MFIILESPHNVSFFFFFFQNAGGPPVPKGSKHRSNVPNPTNEGEAAERQREECVFVARARVCALVCVCAGNTKTQMETLGVDLK